MSSCTQEFIALCRVRRTARVYWLSMALLYRLLFDRQLESFGDVITPLVLPPPGKWSWRFCTFANYHDNSKRFWRPL